ISRGRIRFAKICINTTSVCLGLGKMTTRRQRKSSFEVPSAVFTPAGTFFRFDPCRLLHRLPLHVRRNISAAAFKGNDVIDDVTLPPSRVACPPHELTSCRGAPLDLAVAVPFGDRRFLRN